MTGNGPGFSKPIAKPTAKSGAENADLALVCHAWSGLPGAIKAGIMAMVRACSCAS
jgi:hypothetical protein